MLKALDLFGFKSFADRTRFDFALGINVVVGPNGSGKSNVVDSMKWILGDQSPKSLRGKEMTDVIFNGSSGRKPAAFAEASLTFDNTTRFLPVETDEVVVGRRLWRNGDSEYLINGAVARLKDIKDVFSGTGAATSAYSIIEQGRVDQILHANAAARRSVFEEAAGISKFKARKVDAIKKLERVTQNLLRLTDIVQQLESQLNSTRNQAAKAAKWREVSEELKKVWLGLVADDHRFFNRELSQLDAKLAGFNAEIDGYSQQQQAIETRLASFDQELNGVEDQLRDAERRASANREIVVSQDTTMRHATNRLRELESELVRLRRQRGTTDARLKQVAEELEASRHELDTFDDTYLAQQNVLQQHDEQLVGLATSQQELLQQLEIKRHDRAALVQQGHDTNQRLALLQAQIESLQQTRKQLSERREALSIEIDSCQLELGRRQAAVNEVLTKSGAVNESYQSIRSKQKKLLKEQEATGQRLAELREKRSGASARATVLEDLEQRQEGLAIGVKEILNRARSSNSEPWNRILGSVADLLEVELDNAALLEVALGNRAQMIVLDEVAPLIEYLNRSGVRIEGRVGFIGLKDPAAVRRSDGANGNGTTGTAETNGTHEDDDAAGGNLIRPLRPISPTTAHPSSSTNSAPTQWGSSAIDLRGDRDVLHRADDLVNPLCPRRDLAERLLANTWVVTSLDAALRLAAAHPPGLRFVTMAGELLEADGSVYAGTLRGETAILSRKSELRRLKNDIIRFDQSVDSCERQMQALSEQLAAIESEMTTAAAQRDELNDRVSQIRSEFERQQQVLDRFVQDRDAIDTQLAENSVLATEANGDLDRSRSDLFEIEEAQQGFERAVSELEQQRIVIDEQRHKLIQLQTEEKLKLAKKEERRSGLSKTVERLQSESKTRREEAEEVGKRFKQLSEQRREVELQLLNASAELAEVAIHAEKVADEVAALSRQKQRMRSVRAELGEEETRIRQARNAVSDKLHAEELRAREIRHQLTTCGQRIEEEYALSLDQVVSSGASAFRDLLIARGICSKETFNRDPLGSASAAATNRTDGSEGNGATATNGTTSEGGDATTNDDAAATVLAIRPNGPTSPIDASIDSEDLLSDDDLAFAALGLADDAATEPTASVSPVTELAPSDDPLIDPTGTLKFEDVRAELDEEVNRLRRKLKSMGSVNTDSLKEIEELETKFQHFHAQLMDLTEAKETLEDIIKKVNAESKRIFFESFEAIRKEFRELFRKLFGGGDGDVILEDPEDVLDCGIDIVARPPGKELRSISLLSGGEKTLTAVALLLAIFKSRPSPFCILDEVDAALDDANVERYASVVREFRDTTQFIIISHRKRTMVVADIIYGVTMEQSGVSKRMSVRFEDVGENGEFKAPPGQAQAA